MLHLYNTLSNSVEKFHKKPGESVSFYLCGPTVYDYLHIGNFRGPIVFNLMRNWMDSQGYDVTFVYNYTDVDDKIINRAKEEDTTAEAIAEKYIKEFELDFKKLGLKPHDHNPRVTDHISEIVRFIEGLLEKEVAYEVEGEVFYQVDRFEGYGKLSKKKLEDLEAGSRVEVDQRKRTPFDFVLWKPAKPGEPSWDSPWGAGRPGWHIECSVMAEKILGKSIDIHGGGIDLIFPHHENEIAQSEGLNGCCFSKFWVHNDFINVENQKMSKSLGNVLKARFFMEEYHPEILKYLFLSAHYRTQLSLSDDKIIQVIKALSRIYSAKELAQTTVGEFEEIPEADPGFQKTLKSLDNKIKKALNDDLNSAEFLSFVFEGVRAFNALGFAGKKRKPVYAGSSKLFLDWLQGYGELAALFEQPANDFLNDLDNIYLKKKKIDRSLIESKLKEREEAREQKDWAKSDQIRDELKALGIALRDGQARAWSVDFDQ